MSGHRFQFRSFFLRFFICQISCSIFWLDRTFQASAQILLDNRFKPNSLKFPVLLSFDIQTFVPIYCYAVVQILSNLHEHEYSAYYTIVNQYQTSCMLLCIISLLHTVHTSSAYLNLFYAHCSLEITVCSIFCN